MNTEYEPAPVGYKYDFTSREGGGAYTVVGHVSCERCKTLCEDREWTEPSRKHRKKGRYYSQYYWCPSCGLYKPNESSKEVVIDYMDINSANDMRDCNGDMIEIN